MSREDIQKAKEELAELMPFIQRFAPKVAEYLTALLGREREIRDRIGNLEMSKDRIEDALATASDAWIDAKRDVEALRKAVGL